MKHSFILLLFLTVIFSCRTVSKPDIVSKDRMRITIEVVPESDSSYSITWKDTIGSSEGYKIHNRPYEIWCFVMNKSDTLGYYKGLSTPSDFTYFSTRDTIVEATFMVGSNVFSAQYYQSSKEKAETVAEYKSIELNLKNDLRKPLEFVLTKKENHR